MDTSVLISAIYSAKGHARDLLMLAAGEAPPVQLVISADVMFETRSNLAYKSPDRIPMMQRIFGSVAFEIVTPAQRLVAAAAKRFPISDAAILAAARKAKIEALVTYDKKHLLGNPAVAAFVRAPVLRPQQAIALLETSN